MLTFNEGKVCEAIVQRLEGRLKAPRMDMRWPEDERHPFPVEIAFTVAGQLFALEHTGIEPFGGHVKMEAEASRHFTPIVDALKNALGTSSSRPTGFAGGRCRRSGASSRRSSTGSRPAPTLPKRLYADYRGTSVGSVTVPGVPFAMSLYRFEPALVPGHYFQIKHLVQNAEQSRIDRIRESVEKKFMEWPAPPSGG